MIGFGPKANGSGPLSDNATSRDVAMSVPQHSRVHSVYLVERP